MTNSERVAALEAKCAELVAGFQELRSIAEQTAVDQNMLLGAVRALIEAAPNAASLAPVLRRRLGTVESDAVFLSQNEKQVEAAQDVQAFLLLALAKAESRSP